MVTHNSKSDLPLVQTCLGPNYLTNFCFCIYQKYMIDSKLVSHSPTVVTTEKLKKTQIFIQFSRLFFGCLAGSGGDALALSSN